MISVAGLLGGGENGSAGVAVCAGRGSPPGDRMSVISGLSRNVRARMSSTSGMASLGKSRVTIMRPRIVCISTRPTPGSRSRMRPRSAASPGLIGDCRIHRIITCQRRHNGALRSSMSRLPSYLQQFCPFRLNLASFISLLLRLSRHDLLAMERTVLCSMTCKKHPFCAWFCKYSQPILGELVICKSPSIAITPCCVRSRASRIAWTVRNWSAGNENDEVAADLAGRHQLLLTCKQPFEVSDILGTCGSKLWAIPAKAIIANVPPRGRRSTISKRSATIASMSEERTASEGSYAIISSVEARPAQSFTIPVSVRR